MYFSEHFEISREVLADENVFDISLVSDLPLFIDPFLIFNSDKSEYQQLHKDIVTYVSFLRDKILAGNISENQEREWFHLSEIPNNWLGYSVGSNAGHGLGSDFARAATIGLKGPVSDFGNENHSKGSHIERLFLFSKGAGKDALSDFVTNLCHEYLLDFTQEFAQNHLNPDKCKQMHVRRVRFDYQKERWIDDKYYLPIFNFDYVLLTPVDLITQSVPWINRPDLFERFGTILQALPDIHLRGSVNDYLNQKLAPPPNHPRGKEFKPRKADVRSARESALEQFPELANYYVADKELTGDEAFAQSMHRVSRAKEMYRDRVLEFLSSTLVPSGFFELDVENKSGLLSCFSQALEKNGGKLFLGDDGHLEELSTDDVKLMCTLAWRADGNNNRTLPQFRFILDSKSALQFESGFRPDRETAYLMVVAIDQAKKSRVNFIIDKHEIDGISVASITGNLKGDEIVESVFISYTKVDENWARWIGSVLQSAGYSVTAQYKDFLPGTNFVQEMEQAVKNTDRTIAVLSPDYLQSGFAASEWQAAFRSDPLGQQRKLVPIRVKKVDPKGLLGSIVYADLIGLTEESATAVLLGALSAEKRPKSPESSIPFPGLSGNSDEYQAFLGQVPKEFKKISDSPDRAMRLELATIFESLNTKQVNILVFTLNPPENQIPPINAAAKDRAAALLDWIFREKMDPSEILDIVKSLPD